MKLYKIIRTTETLISIDAPDGIDETPENIKATTRFLAELSSKATYVPIKVIEEVVT